MIRSELSNSSVAWEDPITIMGIQLNQLPMAAIYLEVIPNPMMAM